MFPMKTARHDAKHVPKRWGHETWWHNGAYCAKELLFEANQKCSLHYHVVKDEVLIVTKGSGWIVCGQVGVLSKDQIFQHIRVDPGDTVHMPRQTLHRIVSDETGLVIFEASTHHEDADSIRVDE